VIGPYVQGITIDKTNFTNSNYGVYVGSPSTGGYQLYVTRRSRPQEAVTP